MFWLVPALDVPGATLFPMEMLLAIGTATPVKAAVEQNILLLSFKEIMEDITDPAISSLHSPPDSSDKEQLLAKAQRFQRNYLLDIRSAETHRRLLERILGMVRCL